jgi:lysozyme
MSLLHLRDVSNWQGPVDWRLERRNGLAAVYVKVSEGQVYVDLTAARRIRNASWARIPVGGYHFCTPGVGSGESQADRLLALAPLRPGQLRPCLDCEANPLHLNEGQLAAWYLGAVTRVHRRTGYWPVIYGSPSYLRGWTVYHPEVFGRCPLWLAEYGVQRPSVPAPWSHWSAWQWTSAHTDPAIKGRVDDSFVADLKALKIPAHAQAAGAMVKRFPGRLLTRG